MADLSLQNERAMAREEKKGAVLNKAKADAKVAGIIGGICSGTTVFGMYKTSPWFRKSTGVSGRVALTIMPAMAAYALVYEKTMVRLQREYEFYGMDAVREKPISHLAWYHKAANFSYTNPLVVLGGIGAPVVGGIFWYQNRGRATLQLGQKIMQTRVLGQFSVLGLLVATMVFRDYMSSRGGLFIEEGGEVHHAHKESSEYQHH